MRLPCPTAARGGTSQFAAFSREGWIVTDGNPLAYRTSCDDGVMTLKKKTRALVGSRPAAFTDSLVQKLREAFCMDFTITEACAYVGISRQAYHDECKRNPKFVDAMERSQPVPFALAKNVLERFTMALHTHTDH